MSFFDFKSRDIAIDLGTSNILLTAKDSEVILKEPSVLALNQKNMNVVATGKKAQDLKMVLLLIINILFIYLKI